MSEDLFSAIARHDAPMVAELLAGGADPNALEPTWAGRRPLHAAIQEMEFGGGLDVVAKLLDHGADINGWTAWSPQTPLLTALFEDQRAAAELLIAKGADPNVRGSEGHSPLRMAVEAGDRAMVSLLLGAGATKTIDDWGGLSGCTALALAAERLDVPMIKMLLDAGADAKAQGEYGLDARRPDDRLREVFAQASLGRFAEARARLTSIDPSLLTGAQRATWILHDAGLPCREPRSIGAGELADLQRRLDAAEEIERTSGEEKDRNIRLAAVMMVRGACALRGGRAAQAEAILREAQTLNEGGGGPELLLLGDAMAAQHRRAEALTAWNDALTRAHPESREAEEARARLSSQEV